MKSKYEALWKCERPGWYRSKTYKTKNFPEKFQILMRYNKFHDPERNTPNFIFSIMDQDSADATAFEFDKDWLEEIIDAFRWIHDEAEAIGNATWHEYGHTAGLDDICWKCRDMLAKYDPEDEQRRAKW